MVARRQPRNSRRPQQRRSDVTIAVLLARINQPIRRFLILSVRYSRSAPRAIGLCGRVRGCAALMLHAARRGPAGLVSPSSRATMKRLSTLPSSMTPRAGRIAPRAASYSRAYRCGRAIAVIQEPAPYAVPPLDFAHRQILWVPPVRPAEIDPQSLPPWLVFTTDDATDYQNAWWRQYYRPAAEIPSQPRGYSRITWANKPVFILQKK